MSFVFEDRVLPNGTHVLVPKLARPRTCRRSDGAPKLTYHDRGSARRARTKPDVLYRCPNCDGYHLATDRRHRQAGVA